MCTASLSQKEIEEKLNHAGSITETHQELTQAYGVSFYSHEFCFHFSP